jgi:hypothetical protein
MKKIALISVLVFLSVFSLSSMVSAYPNSGELIDVFDGNDNPNTWNEDLIEGTVEDWLFDNYNIERVIELVLYDKVDAPATSGFSGLMTMTYESDNMSGTWDTDSPVEFYSVKASTQFALYWLNPLASSGTWNTGDLTNPGGNIPEISHLSTWISDDGQPPGPGPQPVPEPSTMLMLGIGLIGIAGFGRKRLLKK